VFGKRAGRDMAASTGGLPGRFDDPPVASLALDADEIRTLASERCGIIRDGEGLREAIRRTEMWNEGPGGALSRAGLECAATGIVVELIARCALARRESRGAHRRIDYPEKLQAFEKHSMISRRSPEVRFE
jgi:aspartate oxidase